MNDTMTQSDIELLGHSSGWFDFAHHKLGYWALDID